MEFVAEEVNTFHDKIVAMSENNIRDLKDSLTEEFVDIATAVRLVRNSPEGANPEFQEILDKLEVIRNLLNPDENANANANANVNNFNTNTNTNTNSNSNGHPSNASNSRKSRKSKSRKSRKSKSRKSRK